MIPPVNAAARLDAMPIGPFHRRVIWLLGLGMVFDSFDNTLSGTVLASMLKSGFSTLQLNSWFLSATFVGLAIGAGFAGWLSDRYGRAFAFQFNLLLFGSLALLSALAPSMPWLIAIRGLMSVGMGAEYVMCYGMIAELMPAATRGRYLGILGVFAGAGVAITALISVVVVPMLGWRTMFAIGGVGTLFVWWMRRSMPESPRWLEAVGRQDEAEAILRRIEADLPPRAVAPSQPSATKFEGAAHDAAAKRVTIAILFSRSVIRFTLLAATLNVVALSGLYSIAGWMPTFFVSQGMDISKSLWLNAAIMAGSIAGPLPYALLATRVTRRQAMALAGIACAVLAALFPFMSASVAIALCGFCLVATVNSFLNLSLGTTPEFFPTEYRFRGAGVAQTVGRIGLILSPFVVLWLFRSFGVAGVLGVVAVMYLVVTLLLLGQSRLANRSAVWA